MQNLSYKQLSLVHAGYIPTIPDYLKKKGSIVMDTTCEKLLECAIHFAYDLSLGYIYTKFRASIPYRENALSLCGFYIAWCYLNIKKKESDEQKSKKILLS